VIGVEQKLKCVQCDSEKVDIIQIEEEMWVDEELVCRECGAHMTWFGEDEYILHISDRDEWIDLFEKTLEFPFEAEVCEYQEGSVINQGDIVKVHQILDEDDLYGVIVSIRKGRKKYSFPLVDLEPIKVVREAKNLFDAYHYWFANER
jgi:transcription elongation factor Elf1